MEWEPIETAPKDGTEIVALSAAQVGHHLGSYANGPAPIVLRWFKYNGLEAWRDWDADPHWPKWWLPLPPFPPFI